MLAISESSIWQFRPPPERTQPLGSSFWIGFVMALAWCAASGALSVTFAGRVFGRCFTELSDSKKALWHIYSYCLFGGVISNYLLAEDYHTVFYERAFDADYQLNGKPGPGFVIATGFSTGFLAFDLAVMLVWWDRLMIAYKKPMFIQMLIHHCLSVFAWPQIIWRSTGHGIVCWCILTESTSIFLNLNWLLREAGLGSTTLYTINGLTLLVSFFLIRIVTIPWLMWAYLSAPKGHWLWGEVAMSCILVVLPPLLNLYWFSFLVNGVAKFFQTPDKAKST